MSECPGDSLSGALDVSTRVAIASCQLLEFCEKHKFHRHPESSSAELKLGKEGEGRKPGVLHLEGASQGKVYWYILKEPITKRSLGGAWPGASISEESH